MAPLAQAADGDLPVNGRAASVTNSKAVLSDISVSVSVTAKLCAFARAFHAKHDAERVFIDSRAYELLGKNEYENMARLIGRGYRQEAPGTDGFDWQKIKKHLDKYIAPIPLSRAAYAEQNLASYAADAGYCQYVICGAGLDTFSLRSQNKNIAIYEIDRPETQRYKREKLGRLSPKKLCPDVHYVSADFFSDNWTDKLIQSGFSPRRPAFFSILGVTYYLTLPVFEKMLAQIAGISAAGSRLVFDFPDETSFSPAAPERFVHLAKIVAQVGEPMRCGYSAADIASALRRRGHAIEEHLTPQKIQERFFEGSSLSQRAYENIHFILAKRSD